MSAKYYGALILTGVLLGGTGSSLAGAFSWDDADEDEYRTAGQFEGVNEGSGFEAWLPLYPGYTAAGASYLVPQPGRPNQPIAGDYSWAMNGTHAVGRGLAQELGSGQWSFLAAHSVYVEANAGFSGFNLKSVKSIPNADFGEGELIRFGFNRGEDYARDFNRGICYSLNGDSNYHYLGGEDWAGHTLEYTISWNGNGGYSLSVVNQSDLEAETLTVSVVTFPGAAVAMLGTAVYGANLDAQSITFDSYNAVIPEPAAAGTLLAATALTLALQDQSRRRRQRRLSCGP